MTSNSADSVEQPGRTRHRRGGAQAVSGGAAEGAGRTQRPETRGAAACPQGIGVPDGQATLSEFKEDNLTDVAAALTYYAVLSIFPALIALVALVGLVGNPQTITNELTKLVSLDRPGIVGADVQGADREPGSWQQHDRHSADRWGRRGAVDGLRVRGRLHARLQQDL